METKINKFSGVVNKVNKMIFSMFLDIPKKVNNSKSSCCLKTYRSNQIKIILLGNVCCWAIIY